MPRLQFSMRWMIVAVAMMALLLAFMRRHSPEALAIEQGFQTLQKYEPGFSPKDHRVDQVARVGTYWQVQFKRIKGVGKPVTEAYVHERVIQAKRRRFWEPHPKPLYFLTIDASGRKGGTSYPLE